MSTATNDRRVDVLFLVGIGVVAVTARLLFLVDWAGTPLFHQLVGDEKNFHQTALSLLGGAPPEEVFLYQPLYSFYLALVYKLFGVDVGLIRTIQLFLGVGTCFLFYGLGRELGGRWVGRISAFAQALYGPQIFLEGSLLDPGITVPLICGGLWCLLIGGRTGKQGWFFLAGVLTGLAMMARPNLVTLLAVAGIWTLCRTWSWRKRAGAAVIALMGVLVGCSPSWIYNWQYGDQSILVSASGGHSFYLGNNPKATGRFHVPRGERIDNTKHQTYRATLTAVAEQAVGHKLGLSEVSSYWYQRGFSFWADHPLPALALFGKKMLLSVNSAEMPIHHPYVFGQEIAPTLRYLLGFGVLFPFFIIGLWRYQKSAVKLLSACAAVYLLTMAAFYVADRYRILLMPMVLPVSALGMVTLGERFQQLRFRGVWPMLLALAASCVVTLWPMWSEEDQRNSLAEGYNLMGVVEIRQNRAVQAEQYFRRAVEQASLVGGANPRTNLALLLEQHGDLVSAKQLYLEAAAIDPDNRTARVRLANMAEAGRSLEEAIRWWEEIKEMSVDQGEAQQEIERLKSMAAPSLPH